MFLYDDKEFLCKKIKQLIHTPSFIITNQLTTTIFIPIIIVGKILKLPTFYKGLIF